MKEENNGINQDVTDKKEKMEDNAAKQSGGPDFGDRILNRIQESVESMDFASLSDDIQKTVDHAREEVMHQVEQMVRPKTQDAPRRQEENSSGNPAGRWSDKRVDAWRGRTNTGVRRGRKWEPGRLRRNPGIYSGPIEIGLGVLGLAFFGGLGLGVGASIVADGQLALATFLTAMWGLVPLTALGGFLLGKGIYDNKRARRIRDYARIWKGKSYIMLEELQKRSRTDSKRVIKDARFLTSHNLVPGAVLDEKATCLIFTEEAKQQYEAALESHRARQEQEKERQKLEEEMSQASFEEREVYRIRKEGRQYLKQLSDLKQQIESPVMQGKIAQMEMLAARIFVCAAEHPESISQTDRLFRYYFPSVIKLIQVYEDIEEQPIQGDTIKKTRKEIEDSMDTMNTALEKMFDEMFQSVAMDISSDIRVLEVMLRQDGLTDDGMHI